MPKKTKIQMMEEAYDKGIDFDEDDYSDDYGEEDAV